MNRAAGRPCRQAVVALAAFSLVIPGPLIAQSEDGVAVLPGSARSAGLGGAGVALVGDAGSMFANPAGLATIRNVAVEGFYERRPDDHTVSAGAAATRVGRFNYGAGVLALTPPSGTAQKSDVLAVSSLVFRFGLLALGGSVKFVRQTVAGVEQNTWAGDAGIAIALFDIFALAASVQNIGGDLGDGTHLPHRTRAGLTLNYVDPQGSLRLLTTLEGQWQTGRSAVLVVGAEGGIRAGGIGILGRVGATGQPEPTPESAISVGGGLELGRVHLDYAYRASDNPGGGTHQVGIRWTP
ncbi:MAG TPA: UPF0164 family protein [Gemmatimonadales bacterium]|nr:UPF0164 family protein [Gemmatimonadales bacterium]